MRSRLLGSHFRWRKRTKVTSRELSSAAKVSNMMRSASEGGKLPDPAPITGNAMDSIPSVSAKPIAFRTESTIDRREARQSRLIPAT